MRRLRANTDIPTLLEQERDARKRAIAAVQELLSIYSALESAGKEMDRTNYQDSRYRQARWQFSAFLNKVAGTKRLLLSALGALDGVPTHRYTSPEELIAGIQAEEDAREVRRQRRQARRAVNA